MLLALALAAVASACPTIATGVGSHLDFDTAQVVIVRQGLRTTFSVSINPFGDPQEFALVLPVPEVLGEEDVRTLDGTIFALLDGYTAPRHVSDAGCGASASCPDVFPLAADYAVSGAYDDADGGVSVEAEFLVGEYQITILSAEESSSLTTWLDEHGYALAEGSEEILAEYIDGGSFFMAAKVAEDAQLADGSPLSPLQVAYDSEIFSIPIRLATLNSPGEQDMVIYAITDEADGRTEIANYPKFSVDDQCIWGDAAAEDFQEFYDDHYTKAWEAVGDAGWAKEFEGGPYDCNPCTGIYLGNAELSDLGYTGDFYDHYLTRIHMRYTPEQATEELTLYSSGLAEPDVLSYADDVETNYCVPSFCDGTPTPEFVEVDRCSSCGCSGGTPVGLLAAVAGLGMVAGRRRQSQASAQA